MAEIAKFQLQATDMAESAGEAMALLQIEGRKLKAISISVLNQYYNSYKPKQYTRTQDSKKAIQLKGLSKTAMGYQIELAWVDDLTWHDSVLPSSKKKGHSIVLLSSGWHTKRLEAIYGRKVYRHTYYEGFGYLTKVFQLYNNIRNPKVSLEVHIAESLLTGYGNNPNNIK